METCDPVDTPMVEKSKLDEDPQGKAVDPTRYRRMIGTLMYLTSSRPDLVVAVCMCTRYQMLDQCWMPRVTKKVRSGMYQANSDATIRIEYQLADILTKPLARERLEFLIKKLGIRCMSPETLKKLTDEEEE
ncbi:hypothetical protein Tco_1349401 [Tanacetum coccineum]